MNWRVLYVTSRSEKKVNQRLTDLGLESYVPLKTEKRRWSDRMKTVSTPLINGYVFVKVSEKERDIVFKAQGVLNYVRYNGGDATVRDIEITALKSIEEKGYFVEGALSQSLQKGDKVLIKYGPFKGLNGSVKSLANENVYFITIESIGYSLTVKVPEEVLVKNKNL
ncbi:MAG: UpxY family transcription antiterminator [Sphingobacteriaceae bacterium]|nr:UpxY family transcription antiterminator [Sphingobacteriaceae bacterium]MBK7818331.1 UpxY family transcription antiterminator [Sphingobacteriaceae bacterium]